jgi:Ca-activated chloride channel family protein
VRLHAQPDRSLIRAGASSTRYVRLSFTAPESRGAGARVPVNVALVLDRSGSMQGEKIALARSAARQALELLASDDRFSVVVYDQIVDLLVESTPATAEARRRAKDALDRTEARGSTDLCAGWLHGCEQVGLALTEAAVGRCLLLTDGLANHGVTDRAVLLRHAGELRARGVATSTFGVGEGFDDALLRGIAQRSGGNFYFLEHPRQIPDLLASEIGETLEIVARRAALVVTLPAGASATPLGLHEARRRHGGVEIDLGDLVSGQEVEVLVAIRFPRGAEGSRAEVRFSVADREDALDGSEQRLAWTWASHAENDGQLRNRVVDRAVAQAYAARARGEATQHNRAHDLEAARRVLRRTARKIRQYAGDDAELLTLANTLEQEAEEFSGRVFEELELKRHAFASYVAASARAPDGRAKRAPRP